MEHLSNIDAIYKEFPFLENHTKRSVVELASVRRWDTDSINSYYPKKIYGAVNGRWGDYFWYGIRPANPDAIHAEIRLHLLNIYGDTLYIVGESSQNIGQALSQLHNIRDKICYGLERIHYPLYVKSFLSKKLIWKVVPQVLTIIKLPRGIANCEEWVESIANESLKEIQNL